MPPPLPSGERLTDYERKQWVLGDSVGKGGFGEIYLAARSDASTSTCTAAARHVIKIVRAVNAVLPSHLSSILSLPPSPSPPSLSLSLIPTINIQEPHENGPLFVELSFYRRVAKEGLSEWPR